MHIDQKLFVQPRDKLFNDTLCAEIMLLVIGRIESSI